MKKILFACLLAFTLLGAGLFYAEDADASGVTLNYSFLGCDGQVADFDLIATSPTGGQISWSYGVTPVSAPTDNPNYAMTSAVTWKKMVSVTLVTKMGTFRDNAVMLNPCIEDPEER